MAKCGAGQTLAKAELTGARTCRKRLPTAPERFLGRADAVLTPTLLRPPPRR